MLAAFAAGQAKAAPYPEMLSSVCPRPPLAVTATTSNSSLNTTGLLLDEASRLQIPVDDMHLLADRLHTHAFSITEEQLWLPYESFDIALEARSEEAGLLKSRFSESRYQEYGEQIGRLPTTQQDTVRRAALVILAETGYLPEIMLSDTGSIARFLYREACVVNDAPGLMTVYMQGRQRELDLATGSLGPTIPMKPEKATLNDPGAAFSSNGAIAVQERLEQLNHAFKVQSAQHLIRGIHDEILDIRHDPVRLRQRLELLMPLIARAYAIEPVHLNFDSGQGDGGTGHYQHDTSTYSFYYHRYAIKLDQLIQRENLDLSRPEQRRRAQDYMFGELVNNAAHELAHAGQHQWIDAWNRDPEQVPAELRARIADYQRNDKYRNTAWESHALIGLMGDADYERYRHQPLEEDAWAVGAYAEYLALQLTNDGGPAIETRDVPDAPSQAGNAAAVNRDEGQSTANTEAETTAGLTTNSRHPLFAGDSVLR
ncbi:MAG: hypothetical protein IT488_05615 [Gammaproteobacteria bacterium]|nr:hypothetical protein [Gammaproteobacteria bacterium]